MDDITRRLIVLLSNAREEIESLRASLYSEVGDGGYFKHSEDIVNEITEIMVEIGELRRQWGCDCNNSMIALTKYCPNCGKKSNIVPIPKLEAPNADR